MNKIKKVLLFAMSFVMATGLLGGCMMLPQTNNSSSQSTISESSSESSTQSSSESLVESSEEASTESSEESSEEASTESSKESSKESSVESSDEPIESSDEPIESSDEPSTESSEESSSEEETQKYSLTFIVGDPRLDPNAATTTEVEPGTVIAFPAAPEAEGKTFTGWEDIEGNPVEEGAVMPEEDFAIYATWEITAYTLTIQEEGKEDVTLHFGVEAVPATETTPEIIDINILSYVLEGLLPAETEDTVFVFEGIPEDGWTLADTTITLVEKVKTYWLTIRDGNPMDPSAYYEQFELEAGAMIELPAREDTFGKTFIGWFYTDLETGEEFAAPETMPKFDIAIYAKWELETKTLTINKVDGSVETYAIAVETEYDYFNPITGLDDIPSFLENIMTEPFSAFYTVSYEGIPETWELQDYTITEKAVSSIAYFDRLNKTWSQKPNNANNYWDGCEGVVTVEHLDGAITRVGFDATKFTTEEVAAGNTGWAGWGDNRQMWVTFAVPVNGANLNKYTATLDVKFENMTPSFNVLATKIYVGNEGYDFEMGGERGFRAENAEDLGHGWYRFTIEIPAGDVVGEAADYLLLSFDNTAEGIDKSLPSYAYIANFDLLCKHEYSADCDPTCDLCGEERYGVEHGELGAEYISDDFGMHHQVCLVCGAEVQGWCELTYIYDEVGHYEACALCGYETEMYAHDLYESYNDEGHYAEGCYCGYIISDLIPHNKVANTDDWEHWESCTDCWWTSEWIPHTFIYEVTENGHKVLGCEGCDYVPENAEEMPHEFTEWIIPDEKYNWLEERECVCGCKQTLKNRLDKPIQHFLVEEEVPTLDLTDIFVGNINPATVKVVAISTTYSYWDFAAGKDGGEITCDFYTGNPEITVNEDGKAIYALDAAKLADAPYFYGYKTITVILEFENGSTKEIPVTIYAVTKVIRTVSDLIELGVGGKAGTGTRQNSDVAGNDVIGYFLLGNDIDCGGAFIGAGYSYQKSLFKHATFEGNGHTISNFQVGAGGIFGGMYASTVQNVNFEGVVFNGNTNNDGFWGNYAALFAHYTNGGCKFTNINVQFTGMDLRRDNYQFDDGLLVSGLKNDAKFTNITIDASGLDIECALGYDIAKNTPATYENVVIYAKSVKVIGYTNVGGKQVDGVWVEQEKLNAWPTGVTFFSTTSSTVEDEYRAHCTTGEVTLRSEDFVEGEIYYIGEDLFICGVAGELDVVLNLPVGGTYKVVVRHQAEGVEHRTVFTNVVLMHTSTETPNCGEYYICELCEEAYGDNGHKGAWVVEGDKEVYSCQCGAEHMEIVTRLTERQRLVANWTVVDGKPATTTDLAIDISGIGEYESATITFGGISYDPTNLTAGSLPITEYGEKNLVVTVVTADGVEHSVTVPVIIVTAIFKTAAELDNFYILANAADNAQYYEGGYFELGANISYNAAWTAWGNWKNHSYLNAESSGFKGVLDGCGYTIDGLEINNGTWAGFVSVISSSGVIKNVGFTNAKITGHSGFLCTVGNGLVENVYIKYAAGEKTNGSGGYNAAFMAIDNPKGMTTYMTVRDCFIDGSEVTANAAWSWFATNAHASDVISIKFEGVYVKQAVNCSLVNRATTVSVVEGSAYGYFSDTDADQLAERASWNTKYWTIGEDKVPVWNSSINA